ncbi:HAD family hydrolase [Sandarakinorhabdus rubra]|uniref:HAD family hydrolase n=1 Tax=Sandarakinorhabdus rubra TaxID=2672568 RepID=UPI0013DD5A73|nr:HAD family hydrolase [Sandarakinorhabdus rubra]
MKARPLIVSDCDGVLLHFIAPFVDYLREVHGLTLRMDSFALTGNVKQADGTPVPASAFPPLLDGFFADWMHNQHPIAGAADALGLLARECDVVVLTNIAGHHADRRTTELARVGMPYRVIGNQGGKGAPLRKLLDEFQPSETIFIDDLPPNHASVATHAPHVHRLHMVAEAEVRHLIPAAPDAHARHDDWPAMLSHIETILKGKTP